VSIASISVVNKITPIGFVYKRTTHDLVGYYNEALPVLGDWDFYLRFLSKFDIGVLPEPLANYHVRDTLNGIELAKEYENSIADSLSQHTEYTPLIRNKHFRFDSKDVYHSGNVGLLLQFAQMLEETHYNSNKGLLLQIAQLIDAKGQRNTKRYIDSILLQIYASRTSGVAIFGTGKVAKELFKELMLRNIKVICFINSDSSQWGTECFELPVCALEDALECGCKDIVIGSTKNKQEMINDICKQIDVNGLRLRLFCA
jgi:hypothetical protein